MAHQIDRIENHLESFFEGTLSRLVGLEMSPSDVAIKLSRAMSDGVRRNDEGLHLRPINMRSHSIQKMLKIC